VLIFSSSLNTRSCTIAKPQALPSVQSRQPKGKEIEPTINPGPFGTQKLIDWSNILDVSESAVNGVRFVKCDGVRGLLAVEEC
jgi:hypothetical protein